MIEYKFNKHKIIRNPSNFYKTKFEEQDLISFFENKQNLEALFLASPVLVQEYKKYQKGELKDKKKVEKLIFSLLKYALRMHTRCTPFGLFSGCGVADNEAENVTISSTNRVTRLDMNYSCSLLTFILKIPEIQQNINYYVNSSLYSSFNKYRYVEYFYKDTERIHQITSVDKSPYLKKILDICASGSSLDILVEALIDDEIDQEMAEGFIQSLIDSQIIVSELEPTLTGEENINVLLDKLEDINTSLSNPTIAGIIGRIKSINEQLIDIDNATINEISRYIDFSNEIKELGVEFNISKLFQADKYFNYKETSKPEDGNEVNTKLSIVMEVLKKMASTEQDKKIESFKEKFEKKYEGAEVSLLTALDVESGVGYGSVDSESGDYNPLIHNMVLPNGHNGSMEIKWSSVFSILLRKLINANAKNEKVIKLKLSDFDNIKKKDVKLADSVFIMYRHLGVKDNEPFLSISNIGGSSATNLLGRFSSTNSDITNILKEVAENEQELHNKAIIAEIVHLPESRTGNILKRETIRDFEIPYLANASVKDENKIPTSDLYLKLEGNRIVLFSKSRGVEILPKLGNAHNFAFNSLPVYNFLCDLQYQDCNSGLYFEWGPLSNEFDFLPRVEVANVIVSRATWVLRKKEYKKIIASKKEIQEKVSELSSKYQLPNLFVISEGDNELLIDLESDLSRKLFHQYLNKYDEIQLKEFVFSEDNAMVKDEQGRPFTNEIIAILEKNKEKREEFAEHGKAAKLNTQKEFYLGSEWLYYKIYCGTKSADLILTEGIKPLVSEMIEAGLIDSWFFIRYADPENHLRVRFHLSDTKNLQKVISLFNSYMQDYIDSGSIWKLQNDPYVREISRYGSNTIAMCEELFYRDSQFITEFLDLIEGDEGEEIRWLFAIRCVNELLDSFNLSLDQKIELLGFMSDSFTKEFNMDKYLKKQLDKSYRDNRKKIEEILDKSNDETSDLLPLFELLAEKNERSKDTVDEISRINAEMGLEVSLFNLLSSLIHMTLNRTFKSKQRLNEMVVYYFMNKQFISEKGKRKYYVVEQEA